MKPEEQSKLMALPLDEKIDYSKSIIKEVFQRYPNSTLYLAWTGGKDSTTMLWLYRETCKDMGVAMPKAIFIDEGNVFEEIHEFIYKVKNYWEIELTLVKNTDLTDKTEKIGDIIHVDSLNARNRHEIEAIGFTEKSFPFEPESFVGNHLMKTVALNVFLETNAVKALSTAIRWDEQEARTSEKFFSPRETPPHIRVHSILHFKERDIWDTIHKHQIPFCSLYSQGYRSLGAKGSTVKNADIPAWEQDLENTPERAGRGQDKEGVMAQLRSLGYM